MEQKGLSKNDVREYVYNVLFAYTFQHVLVGRDYEMAAMSIAQHAPDMLTYFEDTTKGVVAHYDELVALVKSKTKKPDVSRTDLVALVYGAYELCYVKDLPVAVVINAAVQLAGKFGGENSGRFVNGVLAALLKDGQ